MQEPETQAAPKPEVTAPSTSAGTENGTADDEGGKKKKSSKKRKGGSHK